MRATAYVVLAATLLLWSGNWIVARAVRDSISPGVATSGRLLVVILVLLPFAWRGLVPKLRALAARDWGVLLGLGLTGGGLHLSMQWLGLHYTTVTNGTLYLSTSPIFILLLAAVFLGERIRARQWAGVAISFSGVALIAAHGDLRALAALSFNIGDVLAIASMAMWASYTILLGRRRDTLAMPQLLLMVCALGLASMLPWLAWDLLHAAGPTLTTTGMLAVLYSAIGSLLLAYAGWSYVVARIGAARAGATMHLMPAIAVGLSALFLGEYPVWYHFAGIALILAGVGLSSSGYRVKSKVVV
jgi:drug/metabolite transporter (DMT)-like permease